MKTMLIPWLSLLVAGLVSGCAGKPDDSGTDPLARGLGGDVLVTSGSEWMLVDGELAPSVGEDMSYVYTRRAYTDFELALEVYPVGQVNSGIFVRCPVATRISPTDCYEFNIWDSHENPEYKTGSVVMISPPQAEVLTEDRWNRVRIRVEGSRLRMWVNGVQTNDVNDDRYDTGYIAFQYGGASGMVRFRNIRIVELT